MRIAVNLINFSPSAPLDGHVPERIWIRKVVSYKNLRMFDCRAYVHILRRQMQTMYLLGIWS